MTDELTEADIEAAPEPTDAERTEASRLARRYLELKREVEQATAVLQAKLAAFNAVAERELPEALQRIGQSDFRLLDGTRVRLQDKLLASQLDENNVEGLSWLEEHGGSSLVKTRLLVELDRGDYDLAKELLAELHRHRGANKFKEIALTRHVHPMTLAAWAKQLVEAGQDPPLEKLGVYRRTDAVVGDRRPQTVELKGFVDPKLKRTSP